jgi:hypothetical protein
MMNHVQSPDDPNLAAVPPARPSWPSWAATLFMIVAVAAGVIGLGRFSLHVSSMPQVQEPADRPGAGIIVRSELVHLWLPQGVTELARRHARSRSVQTHEQLRRILEQEDRQDLWYALTTRTQQVDGEFADITMIRRPYDDELHFVEFLDVLATVAGDPPRHLDADFSRASVRLIGDEFLKRDPREVMTELLGHPFTSVKHQREPSINRTLER